MSSGSFTRPQINWLIFFGSVSCAIHFFLSVIMTISGPAQPYIARNVGSDPATVSLQWSVRGAGWMVGSIVSSAVFKRYIRSPAWKISYFVLMVTLGGVFSICTAFARDLVTLFVLTGLSTVTLGSFATLSFSLFVYTMGPIKSRPFTMLLHCIVGLGFLVGSLFVRPFLPQRENDEEGKSFQDVCNAAKDVAGNSTNPSASDSGDILDVVEVLWGLPSIYWPIIISGAAIVFSAWAYIPLAFMTHSGSLEMPIHESQDQNKSKDSSQSDLETITNFYPLIIFVFLFYCISCGIERIFQSTVFTYGLCGPLALSPQSAAISDSSYNGGFLAGRVIGTLIAGFVKPRNMLLVSLTFCLLASIVLVTSAFKSATGLYVGSGLVGFGVSWQYGSAFSWTAQKVDVTGILASLFASACGVGGMASVPVIGFLTSEADPRSMIWAVLVLSILHWGIFGPMWFTAKRLRTNFESYDVKAEQELGSSNVTEKAGEANDGYLAEDVQL